MAKSYVLGEILPEESIVTEYKEFRLELAYESAEESKNLYTNIHRLKVRFNDVMYRNMKKYACKYATSFFNSRVNGEILFGVSDFGEVIGIPMMSSDVDLQCSIMKDIMTNEIRTNVISKHADRLIDMMNLKYILIDTSDHTFHCYPEALDYIRDRKKEQEKYEDLRSKYIKDKKDYVFSVDRHRRSINYIINQPDIREDFRGYLRDHDVFEKYKDAIADDVHIYYEDSEIKTLKLDKETLIYWITSYRDVKTDTIIKDMRPTWDYKNKKVDPYFSALQDFKPMVTNLVERGFNMYIFELTFDFVHENPADGIASYKLDDNIRSPIRTLCAAGDPCCRF